MPVSPYPMVPVDDALSAVLQRMRRLPARLIPLSQAGGLVLAAPVRAAEPMPPFAASSVDGFAVLAGDGPGPRRVVGEVVAGALPTVSVGPGTAARITTGAALPTGADAVVMVEDTEGGPDSVTIRAAVPPGAHVRPVGCDYQTGERVVDAGVALGPAHLGLLASTGIHLVDAHPRPRVAVLSTGDELVEPSVPLGPGQIRDSNRTALTAAVEEAGGLALDAGHLADAQEEVNALGTAVAAADVVVTSGGVSMGHRDLVKPWLAEHGEVVFGRVRVKPGKPATFAVVEGVPVFALPGFPVSALVTFELFVRPALRALAGHAEVRRPRWRVRLIHDLGHASDRVEFQRGHVTLTPSGPLAATTGAQGSGRLRSLAEANALLRLEGPGRRSAGELVEALIVGPVPWSDAMATESDALASTDTAA